MTRERLIENYERVMRLSGGERARLDGLDDRQICIAIEDELHRSKSVSQVCGCGVTVFQIVTNSAYLNYDGSVHNCRRKAWRPAGLYDQTLRGLRRGRS
jgi:hypothetical protein